MLPDATISASCTTYANNVFMLVSSSVEIDKVGKEMQTYEIITRIKISHDKSWLMVGFVERFTSPGFL